MSNHATGRQNRMMHNLFQLFRHLFLFLDIFSAFRETVELPVSTSATEIVYFITNRWVFIIKNNHVVTVTKSKEIQIIVIIIAIMIIINYYCSLLCGYFSSLFVSFLISVSLLCSVWNLVSAYWFNGLDWGAIYEFDLSSLVHLIYI